MAAEFSAKIKMGGGGIFGSLETWNQLQVRFALMTGNCNKLIFQIIWDIIHLMREKSILM
jgi:hypothetical protein